MRLRHLFVDHHSQAARLADLDPDQQKLVGRRPPLPGFRERLAKSQPQAGGLPHKR